MNQFSLFEKVRDGIAASPGAQRLWAYYEAAPPREQLAMTIGGTALALLLVWLLVIAPLHGASSNARAEYELQRETLAWMEANRHRLGAGSIASERVPGEALLTLANRTAARYGISFRRYEPVGSNGLSVVLEGVAFTPLVQWLGELERSGVVAAELSVRQRNEPGLVDARIVIEE
jgi:general secretion pathway protein M